MVSVVFMQLSMLSDFSFALIVSTFLLLYEILVDRLKPIVPKVSCFDLPLKSSVLADAKSSI